MLSSPEGERREDWRGRRPVVPKRVQATYAPEGWPVLENYLLNAGEGPHK